MSDRTAAEREECPVAGARRTAVGSARGNAYFAAGADSVTDAPADLKIDGYAYTDGSGEVTIRASAGGVDMALDLSPAEAGTLAKHLLVAELVAEGEADV